MIVSVCIWNESSYTKRTPASTSCHRIALSRSSVKSACCQACNHVRRHRNEPQPTIALRRGACENEPQAISVHGGDRHALARGCRCTSLDSRDDRCRIVMVLSASGGVLDSVPERAAVANSTNLH